MQPLSDNYHRGPRTISIGMVLLSLGVMMDPIHLWRSGFPQVSDFVFACFVLVILIQILCGRMPFFGRSLFLPLIYFLCVAILVSLLNAIFAPIVLVALLRLSFVVILAFSFWQVLTLYNSQEERLRFAKILAISIIVSFFLAVSLNFHERPRFNGSFNNPNQLGFYLVCVCCFSVIFIRHQVMPIAIPRLLILASYAVVFATGSLAGIFALSVSAVTWLVFDKTVRRVVLISGALAMISYPILGLSLSHIAGVEEIQATRLVSRAQNELSGKIHDFLAGERMRGHDVFVSEPQNALWGVGRGSNDRFGAKNEIHSTYGSILYSYGVVGFLAFFEFFRRVRPYRFALLMLVVPVWVWAFFHHTLNYPLFWILHLFWVAMEKRLPEVDPGFRTR